MSINYIISFAFLYIFTIYFILFSTIRRQKYGQSGDPIGGFFNVTKRRKYLQTKRW